MKKNQKDLQRQMEEKQNQRETEIRRQLEQADRVKANL